MQLRNTVPRKQPSQTYISTLSSISSLELPKQIKSIIETIEAVNQSIQFIKSNSIHMDQTQLKNRLHSIPNLNHITTQISNYFNRSQPNSKPLLYQIPIEVQLQHNYHSHLYQIPLEIIPFAPAKTIYELPVEMNLIPDTNAVVKYLSEFQKFEKLPSQIQRTIIQLQDHHQLIYQIPIQMYPKPTEHNQLYQIPIELTLKPEQTIAQENAQVQTDPEAIENVQNYQIEMNHVNWDQVEDAMDRMKKIWKDISENESQNNFFQDEEEDIVLTGNIIEDLQNMKKDQKRNSNQISLYQPSLSHEKQIYQIPVQIQLINPNTPDTTEIEIQCDLLQTHFVQIPIYMESYTPQLSLESNTIQLQIYQQKLSTPQKQQNNPIQLSSSIESVFYDFQNQENKATPMQTPVSNRAVGWDHPELDFCDSSEIAKSQSLMSNSFGGNGVYMGKQSLQFKESYIPKKVGQSNYFNKTDVNSIFQTLNMKANNPIYIIASESSSEENTPERQMYMSELRQKNNPKMNFKQRYNLKEESIEVSQYFDMREKVVNLEEEKVELLDQLRMSELQIRTLREEINLQKEALSVIERGSRDETSELKEILDDQKKQLSKYKEILEQKQEKILQLQNQIEDTNNLMMMAKVQKQTYKTKLSEASEQSSSLQQQFIQDIEKIQSELRQKDQLIRMVEKQYDQQKQLHRNEVVEFVKANQQLRSHTQELNRQIESKRANIQELRSNHDELISQLELACRERSQITHIKALYSNQYQKMKQFYEYELNSKDRKLKDVNFQNQRLHKEILSNIENYQEANNKIKQQNQIINQLREEVNYHQEELRKEKFTLSAHVEAEMDYLRRQLIYITSQSDIKDLKIKELTLELKNAIHISPQSSTLSESTSYVDELKEIIGEYERIILSHHQTIQELQQRVYQYLGDAIDKEQQAQKLYDDVLNYETDLNEVMLEKIAVDLENKKLRRMIQASERKISSIGSRLNYVVKDRIEEDHSMHETLQSKYRKCLKSQNSTIKLGLD